MLTGNNDNIILCDNNKYSRTAKEISESIPMAIAYSVAAHELKIIDSDNVNNISTQQNNLFASRDRFYDAVTKPSTTDNISDYKKGMFLILHNPVPIIDGCVIELPKNNPLGIQLIYRTDGENSISIHNGKINILHSEKISKFQSSEKNYNYPQFDVMELEKYCPHCTTLLKDLANQFSDKYGRFKEIGAFVKTTDSKIWICHKDAAQTIADVDNWLLSLLYHYYCWTNDQDLIDSITHSGGIAGQKLPKFINYQLT